MKLADAEIIAKAFAAELAPACERIEIVGSVRRRRPEVGDLDVVLIPQFREVKSGMFDTKQVSLADDVLTRLKAEDRISLINDGEKMKRGIFLKGPAKDFSFDIYVATAATFATLTLIRTGSREHNIFLCKRAAERGGKLHANGDGVVNPEGKLVRCQTEAEVFAALGMDYVAPELREIAR